MLLRAAIEPRAAESSENDPAGERREIVVEADDFVQGRQKLTGLSRRAGAWSGSASAAVVPRPSHRVRPPPDRGTSPQERAEIAAAITATGERVARAAEGFLDAIDADTCVVATPVRARMAEP